MDIFGWKKIRALQETLHEVRRGYRIVVEQRDILQEEVNDLKVKVRLITGKQGLNDNKLQE